MALICSTRSVKAQPNIWIRVSLYRATSLCWHGIYTKGWIHVCDSNTYLNSSESPFAAVMHTHDICIGVEQPDAYLKLVITCCVLKSSKRCGAKGGSKRLFTWSKPISHGFTISWNALPPQNTPWSPRPSPERHNSKIGSLYAITRSTLSVLEIWPVFSPRRSS